MIPTRLLLKNFLSYSDDVPPLDFTSFHVACISGANGHGKSALLDAITWALWGEARKAGNDRKPDDGLLRIGTTEMSVTFDFQLEEDQYRVTRSYRKTPRSGTTSLELQVYNPDSDSFRALSEEGSLRKTQESLNTLLRMGYDTFINSAFILQGRADEFTRRNARDRKTILGEILGLSRYDDLAALARTHVQTADLEIARTRERLVEIEAALAQIKALEEKLSDTSSHLVKVEKELDEADSKLTDLRKEESRIALLRQEATTLSEQLARLNTEIEHTASQLAASQEETNACRMILNSRNEITASYEKYQTLQTEERNLRATQERYHELERKQADLDREITKQHHEVERRRDQWDRQITELKNEIDQAQRDKREIFLKNQVDLERKLETSRSQVEHELKQEQDQAERLGKITSESPALNQQLEIARKKVDQIQELERDRDKIREAGNEANLRIETLKQQLSTLAKDQQKIQQQRASLSETNDPNCPLCGNDLDAHHRAEVLSDLDRQLASILQQTAQLEEDAEAAETLRTTHRSAYQAIKNQLANLEEAALSLAKVETGLRAAEEAATELELIRQRIRTCEEALKDHGNSDPAIAVDQAGKELDSLKHDADAHTALVTQLKEISVYEQTSSSLKTLEAHRRRLQDRLFEAKEKLDTAKLWLAEKRYAKVELDHLEKVQKEAKELEYDPRRHREISEELAALSETPGKWERLLAAERQLSGAESRLEAAGSRMTDLESQKIETARRADELGKYIGASADLEARIQNQQLQITKLREQREQQLRTQASLQSRLADCRKREAEHPSEKARLKAAEQTARIHRELIIAFGKDGIQALIVEQAIPEIEEEANRILSRLTDNRTQISLESLRDLKKGGTRETLDIRISDELGERSYELYSGGEAFRVDFATRIALSRLLARRAGTRLRTLVIDEGFGTQDNEGLNSLIEAIQSISDDFEKILVITHVESLKQAFPVRIEVTKYPDSGSRYEVYS
jgi:exonuclease SbcC